MPPPLPDAADGRCRRHRRRRARIRRRRARRSCRRGSGALPPYAQNRLCKTMRYETAARVLGPGARRGLRGPLRGDGRKIRLCEWILDSHLTQSHPGRQARAAVSAVRRRRSPRPPSPPPPPNLHPRSPPPPGGRRRPRGASTALPSSSSCGCRRVAREAAAAAAAPAAAAAESASAAGPGPRRPRGGGGGRGLSAAAPPAAAPEPQGLPLATLYGLATTAVLVTGVAAALVLALVVQRAPRPWQGPAARPRLRPRRRAVRDCGPAGRVAFPAEIVGGSMFSSLVRRRHRHRHRAHTG